MVFSTSLKYVMVLCTVLLCSQPLWFGSDFSHLGFEPTQDSVTVGEELLALCSGQFVGSEFIVYTLNCFIISLFFSLMFLFVIIII